METIAGFSISERSTNTLSCSDCRLVVFIGRKCRVEFFTLRVWECLETRTARKAIIMDKWMSPCHQVLFLIWEVLCLIDNSSDILNTSHSVSSKFSTLGALASVKFQYSLLRKIHFLPPL